MPLFHEQSGDGFPLVFIHGFCESSSYWDGIHDEFSREFKIITIDLPGFGKSPLHDSQFSLEEIADMVVDFLKSKSIRQFMVVGHSLGGYVALEMLRKYPTNTLAICLLNSSAFADPEDKKENRNKLIEFISQHGVEPFLRTFVPSLFYPQTIRKYEPVIRKISEEGMSINPESVIYYTAAMRDRSDSIDLLERYPDRILLIAGEHDQNVPLEKSLEMASKLGDGNSHIMPDSAHMSFYEHREMCYDTLRTFARKLVKG